MEIFASLSLPFIAGIIALLALWKDWRDYGTISKRLGRTIPIALAVLIILIMCLSLSQTWYAEKRESKNIGRISELANQLQRNEEAAERRSKQQAETFQTVLSQLYDRLSELQAKVNTDPLLRQNQTLMKEMQEARDQITEAKVRFESQRQGVIKNLVAELIINHNMASKPPFIAESKEDLKKYAQYPHFQTAGLSGALSSGLFLEDKDRELYTRIADLHEFLLDFNNRLETSQNIMLANASRIYELRDKINNGPNLKDIKSRVYKLMKLLVDHYGIREDYSPFATIQ